MVGEPKIQKLSPEQRELKDRINDRMRNVGAEEYDRFILERGRDKKATEFVSVLSGMLDKEKSYNALELGTGTGIFTGELNKISNVNLSCLDTRKDLIEWGIKNGRIRREQAIIGDFEKMPIENKSVDIVTGMAIINQRRDMEGFFKEIERVLKDDGFIFFPWIKRKDMRFERETKLLEEHGFEIAFMEGNYILAKKRMNN